MKKIVLLMLIIFVFLGACANTNVSSKSQQKTVKSVPVKKASVDPMEMYLNAEIREKEPFHPVLKVTDMLETEDMEISVETDEWKIVFSLLYNGGIYKMYDKVFDPEMKDNLASADNNTYSQGAVFDYDIYLPGSQEYMTTIGKLKEPGNASLEIVEYSPERVRIIQNCHPRLNNYTGPRSDPAIELNYLEAVTEWTIYPTGKIFIKFDTYFIDGWDGVVSRGPGGDGKGISLRDDIAWAANGTDFDDPWIAQGDIIESPSGGWGPFIISKTAGGNRLQISGNIPEGENYDFIIRRERTDLETISIHADGSTGRPDTAVSYWQGGSNGDHVFEESGNQESKRDRKTPVKNDYVYAHWTRSPRGFGSLLAFFESYPNGGFAVVNDLAYGDISYTQVGYGMRTPVEQHRHFLAQLGTQKAHILPVIKGVPDSLPFADDYLEPWAEARIGEFAENEREAVNGFDIATGVYWIEAENGIAEIAFDSMRNGAVSDALAYKSPAVLVSGIDSAEINVELSTDNGASYTVLEEDRFNMSSSAVNDMMSGRVFQLFEDIPAGASGDSAWVLRFTAQ